MSWNSIKRLIAIVCPLFILSACSTENALQYADKKSDLTVVKIIEKQYKQWYKTPYRYGGTTPQGIDCSAFVKNFYDKKLRMSLPRTTIEQVKLGHSVSKLQAGDLLFFKTGQGKNGLHVGIYYKEGQFLHVSTTRGVQFSHINERYWKKHYWQTKRILI